MLSSFPEDIAGKKNAERLSHVVSCSGKGSKGCLTKEWFSHVDERGLSKHSAREALPDWNASNSTSTKDDKKQAQEVFRKKDAVRKCFMEKNKKMLSNTYQKPHQLVMAENARIGEFKRQHQSFKEEIKRELKTQFPTACEERLQAMTHRMLHEKLLEDEKCARFPIHHEIFKPDMSQTVQDRRYKVYHHPGTWAWNEAEQRECWSCCVNDSKESRGCEHRMVNPDSWCLLGFERPSICATRKT